MDPNFVRCDSCGATNQQNCVCHNFNHFKFPNSQNQNLLAHQQRPISNQATASLHNESNYNYVTTQNIEQTQNTPQINEQQQNQFPEQYQPAIYESTPQVVGQHPFRLSSGFLPGQDWNVPFINTTENGYPVNTQPPQQQQQQQQLLQLQQQQQQQQQFFNQQNGYHPNLNSSVAYPLSNARSGSIKLPTTGLESAASQFTHFPGPVGGYGGASVQISQNSEFPPLNSHTTPLMDRSRFNQNYPSSHTPAIMNLVPVQPSPQMMSSHTQLLTGPGYPMSAGNFQRPITNNISQYEINSPAQNLSRMAPQQAFQTSNFDSRANLIPQQPVISPVIPIRNVADMDKINSNSYSGSDISKTDSAAQVRNITPLNHSSTSPIMYPNKIISPMAEKLITPSTFNDSRPESPISRQSPVSDSSQNSDFSNSGSSSEHGKLSRISTKRRRIHKGATCPICGKFISRDLSRHLRIHENVGRFQCIFPKETCKHKTGYFNRPYDFKKHLLHFHFQFDDSKVKALNNLSDKLDVMGVCHCGQRFTGGDWLDKHVLTDDLRHRCPYVVRKEIPNDGKVNFKNPFPKNE